MIEAPNFQNQLPVPNILAGDPVPTAINNPNEGWDYTARSKEAFGNSFGGREQIGRDTPIDGGVYTGTYGGEAIVVDSAKYPREFNDYMDQAIQGAVDSNGNVARGQVLESVFDTVSSRMRYSKSGVDRILNEIASSNRMDKFQDGTKVPLNEFMKDGEGVCRHMALTAATMLEKMKAAGHIRGDISIERSWQFNPRGEADGHSWVRYTSKSGDVMILDVAQGYFGRLEDSEGSKQGWDYKRPEEKRAQVAGEAGTVIVKADNLITDLPSGERFETPGQKTISELTEARNKLASDLGLSPKDYSELDAYSQAKSMKAVWQQSGNGRMSLASDKNIGEAYRQMSASAQAVADKWHDYNNRIKLASASEGHS